MWASTFRFCRSRRWKAHQGQSTPFFCWHQSCCLLGFAHGSPSPAKLLISGHSCVCWHIELLYNESAMDEALPSLLCRLSTFPFPKPSWTARSLTLPSEPCCSWLHPRVPATNTADPGHGHLTTSTSARSNWLPLISLSSSLLSSFTHSTKIFVSGLFPRYINLLLSKQKQFSCFFFIISNSSRELFWYPQLLRALCRLQSQRTRCSFCPGDH